MPSPVRKVAWFQLDVRTLEFFPPAESWLVNSNFPRASRMQGTWRTFAVSSFRLNWDVRIIQSIDLLEAILTSRIAGWVSFPPEIRQGLRDWGPAVYILRVDNTVWNNSVFLWEFYSVVNFLYMTYICLRFFPARSEAKGVASVFRTPGNYC